MPSPGPIKRAELISYLQILGFEGPYSGGKHQSPKQEIATPRQVGARKDTTLLVVARYDSAEAISEHGDCHAPFRCSQGQKEKGSQKIRMIPSGFGIWIL